MRLLELPALPLLCAVLSSVPTAGCGSKRPETGDVHGRITFNSQPVTAAMVVYENPAESWITASELDAEGRYRIGGVRVGPHTVSVQPKMPKLPSESDSSMEEIKAKMARVKIPDPADIPRQFRSTQTSPLKVSVTAGHQAFDFDLAKAPTP